MPKPINRQVLQDSGLRHFLEVVRTGSVTLAAERLQVAPSAVSRHVARLESELGTLLFERRARGMTPNAAGELLAAHARRAWLDIERVSDELQSLRGAQTGTVRLAGTEGFCSDFLPGLIADFQRRQTGVRVQLEVCRQAEIPQRIRKGDSDIGVTVSSVSERGIRVEYRHPSPILAMVAPGHPLARRTQLSLGQLVGQSIALPGPDSTLRQLIDISCSRQGLSLDPAFECNRLDPCMAYVMAQGGVGFSGDLACRRYLQTGSLVAIPLRDREMSERHFEIQTLAGRPLPQVSKAFLDHLCLTLRDSA